MEWLFKRELRKNWKERRIVMIYNSMYDFYRKVAKILAGENADALFDYIIHAMDDDGGFLRSSWCYFDKILQDWKFGADINTALVTLQKPFDFQKSKKYYVEDIPKAGTETELKMQLFYYDLSDEKRFKDDAQWSAEVGFFYPVKIDMVNETYEVLKKRKIDMLQQINNKLGFDIREYNSYDNLEEEAHERDDIPNPFDKLSLEELYFIRENNYFL